MQEPQIRPHSRPAHEGLPLSAISRTLRAAPQPAAPKPRKPGSTTPPQRRRLAPAAYRFTDWASI
ncbi:hypothetical protein [Pseudoruegeria sp. SHC-113]|uniref:hypothetical protein n=1 Tax=Pseudoruegeria sp. SHC-113 TaxID=2855439 RepID=UPI0021BBA814|nr:hypothetical protein [Pseudoruegeria sp. SHC-113]MCT8161065.1 hypothetical protein [Pseudoruegeria sp. SHC-113]